MKKILLATLEFPPTIGGIATYVAQFARSIDPDHVCVYAPHVPGDTAFDATETYKIIRKKQLLSFFWPRWIPSIFHFFSIAKKEKIEVVLVNHALPLGYAALILKKFRKIPYIIISHGTDVLYATANPWKKKMLKWVIKGAEQVIFNSESIKRRFVERLPEYEHKLSVVYPCPDEVFRLPADAPKVEKLRTSLALQGKKVILSVSRMDIGKGFQHLVHAMPEILAREPHAVWVVVGDGPKRAEIFEAVQKLSLQNVVRFIGSVPHEDLAAYYHLADLFVLLTHTAGEREEGLGLVFLEAASSGLAIVAGKSGGVEEAVIDGETGRVFDVYHEAGKVVDTIAELLGDKAKRDMLGRAAKRRAEAVFNWNVQLEKLKPWLE
ncbi:MAG TPA: glycosyltransferase family 4 protein [Candidatus Magasanikbacteria bacterium]|nr:glycosyltransferase family 4 protein [Candidatus Magasanikbacteria bacterium]